MTAHMIFDFKLDYEFTWKSIFVAERHKFDTSPSMTYYLVVSRDSVRIVLIMSDLNVINVKCTNLKNVYINTNPKDRLWFLYGQDFVVHKGKVVVVVTALYGLKGNGYAWAL